MISGQLVVHNEKDENAFAELNKSNQANIDPYLGVTVAENDRNACVM